MLYKYIVCLCVYLAPPNVSFECLDIHVTHWQHLVKKKMSIFEGAKFINFCRKLRTSFHDEITTEIFRV